MNFSAVTIFCEDIREELGGTHSLIGILPDNIRLTNLPTALPKLAIYTRISVKNDGEPLEPIAVLLVLPESEVELTLISSDFIQASQKSASNSPFTGLITKFQALNFGVPEKAQIKVVVRTPSESKVSGFINFLEVPANEQQPSLTTQAP